MPALHRAALRVFSRLPRLGQVAVVHAVAPTFSVGAIAVVIRADGRVLLVRHSYRSGWGVPGGLIDRNEAPEVAAVREVREETSLNIVLTGPPTVNVDHAMRKVDLIFPAVPAAECDPDMLRPALPEIVECAWFSRDALPDLQSEAALGLTRFATP